MNWGRTAPPAEVWEEACFEDNTEQMQLFRNSGFKVYRRGVAQDVRIYGELHRFIPVIAAWKGYAVGEIEVAHRPRRFGRSRYGWGRAFRGMMDLVTVMFLTRFDARPAHFFSLPGAFLMSVGLMVLGGVQLIMIGVMGEYIAKVLSEIKARPVYFVAEHSLKQLDEALANDSTARTAAE